VDARAHVCEKKRKRGKADRDNPRVYALDVDVRVRFQVGSRPRGEIYGFYYRPYDSLKRHDIYKQSIVCFALSTPRGKTEARYNNHVSLVCKQNYGPVSQTLHINFLRRGGGDELQVVTTIWHLPKPVIKKVNFSIPILRTFRNMYSKK